MSPVATNDTVAPTPVNHKAAKKDDSKVFNPFYSPSVGDDGDDTYQFAEFKVRGFISENMKHFTKAYLVDSSAVVSRCLVGASN